MITYDAQSSTSISPKYYWNKLKPQNKLKLLPMYMANRSFKFTL